MDENIINVRHKQKYDTSSQWILNNPILLEGEFGIESDTNLIKIGNGIDNWSELEYVNETDLLIINRIYNLEETMPNKADLGVDGKVIPEQLPEIIQRDFIENPINLSTEVFGELDIENIPQEIINNIDNLSENIYTLNNDIVNLNQDIDNLTFDTIRIESLAKGASRALVFTTLQQLNNWIIGIYIRDDGVTIEELQIGDNLLIIEREVPDYWWDGTQKQELETGKIDLSNYPNTQEVQNMITESFASLTTEINKKVEEAPKDGRIYARSEKWIDITDKLSIPRYGVEVAEDESNPLMDRIYDAIGMVANIGTSLTDNPQNDYDNVFPFNRIRDIFVTEKAMREIPRFYIKRERYQKADERWYRLYSICEYKFDDSYVIHEMFLKGNVQFTGNNPESDYNKHVWVAKYETSDNNQSVSGATVQVSQTRATMRDNAKAIGDGWTIKDIATWSGLWTLFHIVFANRNSQEIMKGNYSGTVQPTGLTDRAIASCVQIGNVAMSFYGIENLYSNVYKWIDGVNVNEHQSFVSTNILDFSDNTSINYRQIGYVNSIVNGYTTQLGYDSNNKFAELPVAIGGSSSTYYCDYYYQSDVWRTVSIGGPSTDTPGSGVSNYNCAYAPYTANEFTGSRLTYKPF